MCTSAYIQYALVIIRGLKCLFQELCPLPKNFYTLTAAFTEIFKGWLTQIIKTHFYTTVPLIVKSSLAQSLREFFFAPPQYSGGG